MSVAKVTVAATAKTPAKVVEAKTVKPKYVSVHLTEEEKRADPDNFIENPNTKKMVKRDSPTGKKIIEAEKKGEEVPKNMTETERLILVVQTFQDKLKLDDATIKTTLKPIEKQLPRGFPNGWGGKQKAFRHPDKPKQALNPYVVFTMKNRESAKAANPDATNTELMSIMSAMWNETKPEDRVEYEEIANADKRRYEAEMEVFENANPDFARSKTSPDSGKPTKETAYHLYCEEFRDIRKAEFPDLSAGEITKKLAEEWKTIDKAKVDEYQAAANEANKGFEERVLEYHNSPGVKKLSEAEQRKANDPDNYELNLETGRYREKEKPKKVKDASPKKPAKAKPAAKPATKPAATEETENEELLIE